MNVFSKIECSRELLAAKEYCQNQNLQGGTKFTLQVRKTQSTDWGLFAGEDIPADKFIIEYMGEFNNHAEFENRFKENDGFFFHFSWNNGVQFNFR